MLLRNFTKVTLKIGYGKDKIVLPPMTIVNVNECKYPAEYIKKHYGSYVQILTEKQEETTDERADIPAKVKEDMAKQEAVGDVSTVDETGAKEDKEGDDKGADVDAGDSAGEDNNNDAGDIDNKDDAAGEETADEIEGKSAETEEDEKADEKADDAVADEKPAKKTRKKQAKKK